MATAATSKQVCDEMSSDASGNVTFVMTELHEVLKKVFKYLPMKSLNSCSCVCKRWRDLTFREKKLRNQLLWLLFDKDDKHKDVIQQVGCHIQNCPSEPRQGLLICSFNLQDSDLGIPFGATNYPRAAKRDRVRIIDYLQRELPSTCDMYSIVTDGVIGTTTQGEVREMELSDSAACLLWPERQGLNIYPFYGYASMDDLMKEATAGSGSGAPAGDKMAAFTGIPQDKTPCLILLFYTEHQIYTSSGLSATLIKHYDGQVVVAGGHADGILMASSGHVANNCNHHDEEKLLLGIAFCGEHLKTASVVIESTVQTTAAVSQELRRLKEAHIPEDNTIAFMFTCMGRGRGLYNKKNVEADAFHELFPKVPLFGFFGNGELGYEYLPDYNKPEEAAEYSVVEKRSEDDWVIPKIHHAYTSIFVLLHLGPS